MRISIKHDFKTLDWINKKCFCGIKLDILSNDIPFFDFDIIQDSVVTKTCQVNRLVSIV